MNAPSPKAPNAGIHFHEFVGLMAALMAVNALGNDMMLPALPAIGADLGIHVENHRQWIVAFYMAGFGVAQLAFGPLSDRFGRRRILFGAMAVYAMTSFIAAHAASFEMLLIARVLQGMAAASTRVLTVSITRDCYSGRRMARVMSLSFLVFLAVPVLAPSIGQLILLFLPWNGIFYALGLFSLLVLAWAALRLPETLDPARRRLISVASIIQAASMTLRNRASLGYTLASALIFGALMGFLTSSQQIFAEVFHEPKIFPICFSLIASTMAASALINSRIVERFGTRRVSHTALLGLIAISLIHLAVVLTGRETLVSFAILQAATMFFFGLTGSNFGAMAMEDMGAIAGTASSVQGFLATTIGVMIGLLIGQSFDDTTLPLTLGFVGSALLSLGIVLIAEHGRLFRPQHEKPIGDLDAPFHAH